MEKTTIKGDGYTVTIPDESDADTPVIATVYEDKLEQFENDILMSTTHGLDAGLGGRLFARSDTPVEGLYSARYPSEDMTTHRPAHRTGSLSAARYSIITRTTSISAKETNFRNFKESINGKNLQNSQLQRFASRVPDKRKGIPRPGRQHGRTICDSAR